MTTIKFRLQLEKVKRQLSQSPVIFLVVLNEVLNNIPYSVGRLKLIKIPFLFTDNLIDTEAFLLLDETNLKEINLAVELPRIER